MGTGLYSQSHVVGDGEGFRRAVHVVAGLGLRGGVGADVDERREDGGCEHGRWWSTKCWMGVGRVTV